MPRSATCVRGGRWGNLCRESSANRTTKQGISNMLELHDQMKAAADAIRGKWDKRPRAGIILGTGLGSLVENIEVEAALDYERHSPLSPIDRHQPRRPTRLRPCWNGLPVMAMEGRFHMYEGYTLKQITLPVRVMKRIGGRAARRLERLRRHEPLFSACGDIMVIEDHINLMGDNPLIGINDDRLGPRFPDMSEPYDRQLGRARPWKIARKRGYRRHQGVFVAVSAVRIWKRAPSTVSCE
jgi:purine-nucleoside phosphorylase